MPFTQKLLSFTLDMANGDRFVLSGLRAAITATMGGSIDWGNCEVTIYGLTMSLTNRLNTSGQLIPQILRNNITVSAGDSVNGQSVVYQGTITDGWADYASMPNNAFRIVASVAGFTRVQPIPPTTINGAADVATIMSGLAQQGGFHFENNGVNQQFFYPYFPGAIDEQIQRVAAKADINAHIDPTTNTLAIWPKGTSRGGVIPLISPDTGMIGYPTFGRQGTIEVTTIYTPSIRFGQDIQIQSSIPTAAQKWRIISLVHELESMVPGGAWRTRLIGSYPNQVAVR